MPHWESAAVYGPRPAASLASITSTHCDDDNTDANPGSGFAIAGPSRAIVADALRVQDCRAPDSANQAKWRDWASALDLTLRWEHFGRPPRWSSQ